MWKELELAQIPQGNLQDFLMTDPFNMSLITKLAPPILSSIRAWIHLRKGQKEISILSSLKLPFTAINLLIPDINIKAWIDNGIGYLEEIMDGKQLKPFKTLQRDHQLPSTAQYQHMQINHPLKKNPEILTFLLVKIARYYQSTTTSTKGKSAIYSSLQDKNVCEKTQSIRAWEREIGAEYLVQHWEKNFSLIYSSTKSTNLWEMQQKITLRWYLTPYHISKIYPEASPQCWRMCGDTGTLLHVLWSCSRPHALWSQVKRIISIIIGTKRTLTPDMPILSIDLHDTPLPYRTVVSHIILSTRLTILRHWKTSEAPNITEVIHTTHTHGTYEVLHTSTTGKYDQISKDWSPWLDWYSKGAMF